jgi:hypothetical protein
MLRRLALFLIKFPNLFVRYQFNPRTGGALDWTAIQYDQGLIVHSHRPR